MPQFFQETRERQRIRRFLDVGKSDGQSRPPEHSARVCRRSCQGYTMPATSVRARDLAGYNDLLGVDATIADLLRRSRLNELIAQILDRQLQDWIRMLLPS
jgi:hypothetical protein